MTASPINPMSAVGVLIGVVPFAEEVASEGELYGGYPVPSAIDSFAKSLSRRRSTMRLAIPLVLILASTAPALEPADVFVISNKNEPASREVAEHYIAKRKVPAANHIVLDLPTTEDITRADYDAKLAGPLREALKDRKDKVKVLLTVYGVPLRVGAQLPTDAEKAEFEKLKPELEAATKANDKAKIHELTARRDKLSYNQSNAAVDSELMLLWWPTYDTSRWVMNPLYWQIPANQRTKSPPVLLTSRLDGPTPTIAKRLVDDAVAVEEAGGLKGKAYFDARGNVFDPKKPGDATSYGGYDESFREAAALLKAAGLDATVDNKDELFPPNSCKDAALYAGWYSHGKYVPSCEFVQGAVAWHLASSEAVSLRKDSTLWCPNLLKAGVAATMGPVGEPYTVGFPKASEFFGFLATGKYTLVECHARTQLLTSWMTVLVGDPLYNPFAKTAPVKEANVKPSPMVKK